MTKRRDPEKVVREIRRKTSSFVGAGLAGFIQKPFMLRDLEAILRRNVNG